MYISNNLVVREEASKRQLDVSEFNTIDLPVNTQTEINAFVKDEGDIWVNATKKSLEYFDGVKVKQIKTAFDDEYLYEIDFTTTNNVLTDMFVIALPNHREACYCDFEVFAVNASNQVWGGKYHFSAINNAGVVNLVGLTSIAIRENFATNLALQTYVSGTEVRLRGSSGGMQTVHWKLYVKLYKRVWT